MAQTRTVFWSNPFGCQGIQCPNMTKFVLMQVHSLPKQENVHGPFKNQSILSLSMIASGQSVVHAPTSIHVI